MRASVRATAAVPRHLLERRRQQGPATSTDLVSELRALVALEELELTLQLARARANQLREQESLGNPEGAAAA
jgi:hypothetical protein